MAGSIKVEEGKKKARIEIIPLIDVIFFLLATFVLFTLSLNKIASIEVNLPIPAPPSPTPPDPDSVTLEISDANSCYWIVNGISEPIQLSDLEGRIAALKRRVATPRILITGDERAKFGSTVQALDEIRKQGILQVSVETGRTRPTGR
ncbi:MAG: biopolymer transporter ExbD [Opitutaceae bacterium]